MEPFEQIGLPEQLQSDVAFLQNYQQVPHPIHTAHWHRAYEVLYVRRGWGEIQLNADIFPFHPGDVIAIRPGDVHSTGFSSPDGCDVDVLQFTSALLYRSDQVGQAFATAIFQPGEPAFQQLFDALQRCVSAPAKSGQEQMMAGLVQLVVGLLLRSRNRQAAQPLSPVIQEVCAYLQDASDLRLAHVAARFNYSPEHLSRKFHAETGISYRQWCNRLRMERAGAMLSGDGRSIAEIAEALGYSDASSFIRTFGQTYGLTPSAYRRRLRSTAQNTSSPF